MEFYEVRLTSILGSSAQPWPHAAGLLMKSIGGALPDIHKNPMIPLRRLMVPPKVGPPDRGHAEPRGGVDWPTLESEL